MTTNSAQTVAPNGLELEQAPTPLHGVLVYEDLTTGLRAKAVFDHLRTQVDAGVDPRVELWRFDLLESPDVRQEAAQAAADADLLLLSAHDGASLSPAVRHWLDEWLGRRENRPCLLVLSLDRGAAASPGTRQCLADLQGLAEQGGLDFLPHFTEEPQAGWDLDRQGPAGRAPDSSDDAVRHHETPSRWGLNE